MPANHFGFDASQWDAIKEGPVHVLRLVAGADSLIDRAELTSLIEAVQTSARHSDELVQTVMRELAQELERHPSATVVDVDEALAGLRRVAEALEARPDGGLRFRETLLELGATIAESSGAQLTRTFVANNGTSGWARSAGTSATERDALEKAARVLGLT